MLPLLFPLCCTCVKRLEIMLKHVKVHAFIMETLRAFMSGNFTLDSASLARLAVNTLRRYQTSATEYVAMHSSRRKTLASIIFAKSRRGIDTLINHMHARNGFRSDRTRDQRIISPVLSPWWTDVQTKWREYETVCLATTTLLDTAGTDGRVNRLSEGHRSDMLLDLSCLTREECVMVHQHPRIHIRESQKRATVKGKDGFKRGDNSNVRWFRGKGGCKHTGSGKSGKSGTSAFYASYTSVEDYDYDDDTIESADAYQAHNDPVDLGVETETKFCMMMMRKMKRFLHMLLWMMSLTRGTMILTLRQAHSLYKPSQCTSLSLFRKGERQGQRQGQE